jgi:SAM-dependent methyltransferase
MAIDTSPDTAAVEAFAEKTFGDLVGTFSILLATFGDRFGFFKHLASEGPQTSRQLAGTAGVSERYTLEWLSGMTAAGYLTHDALTGTFALPAEHAPVLADEGGPAFIGGLLHQIPAALSVYESLAEAFRTGGGVPMSNYPQGFWDGMQRDSNTTIGNALTQEWIPAMPDLQQGLEQGVAVAEVGCGSGQALIRLAEAFPNSRFVGYDSFPAQVELAIAGVEAAGLSGRVRIERHDVSTGLPERFDVITSFDVVHDAASPAALLAAIHRSLNPGGIYAMLEPAAGESIEDNLGPVGTILYSFSLFYCLGVSLAEGGPGLGTAGLPESKVRSLATNAGFRSVRNTGITHPLYALYELRA